MIQDYEDDLGSALSSVERDFAPYRPIYPPTYGPPQPEPKDSTAFLDRPLRIVAVIAICLMAAMIGWGVVAAWRWTP